MKLLKSTLQKVTSVLRKSPRKTFKNTAGTMVFAALLISTAACSHDAKTTDTVAATDNSPGTRPTDAELNASQAVTNSAAVEVKASHFVEIAFQAGSSQLTDNSRSAIREVLLTASKSGKLDDVKVLAWADDEFPAEKQKELPVPQKRLADRRSQAVASYIKTLKYSVDVDRYNMAERSNILQRWLKTPDARLKNALVQAGLPTTADDPQYPSKASKSVILVTLNQ